MPTGLDMLRFLLPPMTVWFCSNRPIYQKEQSEVKGKEESRLVQEGEDRKANANRGDSFVINQSKRKERLQLFYIKKGWKRNEAIERWRWDSIFDESKANEDVVLPSQLDLLSRLERLLSAKPVFLELRNIMKDFDNSVSWSWRECYEAEGSFISGLFALPTLWPYRCELRLSSFSSCSWRKE